MTKVKSRPFVPPAAEQLSAHLERYPVTGPPGYVNWLPTLLLIVAVVISLAIQDGLLSLLPWAILLGIVGWSSYRAYEASRLEKQTLRVMELSLLRYIPQSLRLAWRLLPQTTTTPELHSQLVAIIARNLDQLRAHESSIVAYNYLLDHLPESHPVGLQMRLSRAMAQLASHQLLDADDSLRRARGMMTPDTPPHIRGLFRLASLYQSVHTHHDVQAIEDAATLENELRPLGVEAGYGYALAAIACRRQADRDPLSTNQLREQALGWWSKATLLIPPTMLLSRFPDLAPLMNDPLFQQTATASKPPVRGVAPSAPPATA